jgi:magnesium transporter
VSKIGSLNWNHLVFRVLLPYPVTPDWLGYTLLEDIVDSFARPIKCIELEVDEIDDLMETSSVKDQNFADMIKKIQKARRRCTLLVRLLSTKDELIQMIISRVFAESAETKMYLQTIYDDVIQMTDNLKMYETILGRAHSNALALITIGMMDSGNVTTHTANRITVIAGIMLPLNLITGLMGINVKIPGQELDDLTSFAWILATMVFITLFGLLLARYIKAI